MLFSLFSCSTLTFSDGPEWIRETPRHPGYAVFVGYGEGSDGTEAKESAYLDVLSKIGDELGSSIEGVFLSELLETGAVSDLGARVVDSYTAPGDDGDYCFVMVQMPEENLYELKSPKYEEALSRTERIRSYLDSALSAYRSNRDTDTIDCVLRALDESLSGPVTDLSLSPESLLDRAEGYLRNIELSLRRGSGASVTVKMERTKGLFHPPVSGGMIRARYVMTDGEGNLTEASVPMKTADNGSVRFIKVNPYMVREGEVVFSVDVSSDLLSSIEAKAPEGFLDSFMALLESGSVHYEYRDRGKLDTEGTVIAVAGYDPDGRLAPDCGAAEAFSAYLSSAGAGPFNVTGGRGDDDEAVLRNLRLGSPGMENYVILRIGITDEESGGGVFYARAESRLSIFRGNSLTPVTEQDSYAAGRGESREEALSGAFRAAAERAAGMALSKL